MRNVSDISGGDGPTSWPGTYRIMSTRFRPPHLPLFPVANGMVMPSFQLGIVMAIHCSVIKGVYAVYPMSLGSLLGELKLYSPLLAFWTARGETGLSSLLVLGVCYYWVKHVVSYPHIAHLVHHACASVRYSSGIVVFSTYLRVY